MRVHTRALGTYIPAHFNEPMNPFPQGNGTVGLNGMGLYVSAHYNEPWNPIVSQEASRGLGMALPRTPAKRVPTCPPGYSLDSFYGQCCTWTYQPNTGWNYVCHPPPGMSGMGCLGCAGLGQTSTSGIDLSSIGTSLSSAWDSMSQYTIAGIPAVYLVIGGGALLMLMNAAGGKTRTLRKAAVYKAKDAYESQVARIKEQYPSLTAKALRNS